MARKNIAVQVQLSHLDKLPEVAAKLSQAGMNITDRLDEIGHLSGNADETVTERLSSVPGVQSVKVVGDEGAEEPADYKAS